MSRDGVVAHPPRWWRDPAVIAWAALLLVAAIQMLILPDPARTSRAAAPFAAALGSYLVVRRVPAISALRVLGGVQAALALATVAALLRALPVGVDDPSGFYRVKVLVTTLAGDHNTVGGLLLVGVVVCAVLAVDDWRWRAGVALTTAGVIASLSRGAAFVLLAAGIGAVIVGARRQVAVTVAAAGAGATAAVTALAAVLGAAPPGVTGSSGLVGASVTGRVDLIVRGAVTTVEQPLLGVGFGRFVDAAGDLPFPNLHAHNAVTHLGAEGGVVGAVAATTLVLLLAVRALPAPDGPVRDVCLVGGAALLAHAQVDVLAGLWSYEVLLAVLLGLGLSARQKVRSIGAAAAVKRRSGPAP